MKLDNMNNKCKLQGHHQDHDFEMQISNAIMQQSEKFKSFIKVTIPSLIYIFFKI